MNIDTIMRTRNRFKFEEGTDENKENMPEKKKPTVSVAGSHSKQKGKEGISGSKPEKKIERTNSGSVRKSVRFSEVDLQVKATKESGVTESNDSISRMSTCSLDESVFKSRLLESSNASTPLSKLSPKDLIDSSQEEKEINANPKFDLENSSNAAQAKGGQKSGTTSDQSSDQKDQDLGSNVNNGSEAAPKRQLRDRKRMNEIGNIQQEEKDTDNSDSESESSSTSKRRSKKTKKRNTKKADLLKSEVNGTKNRSHNLSKSFVDFEAKMAKNEDVQRQLEVERQLLEDFEEVDSFELCIE